MTLPPGSTSSWARMNASIARGQVGHHASSVTEGGGGPYCGGLQRRRVDDLIGRRQLELERLAVVVDLDDDRAFTDAEVPGCLASTSIDSLRTRWSASIHISIGISVSPACGVWPRPPRLWRCASGTSFSIFAVSIVAL